MATSPTLRWLSNGYAAGTFASFARSSKPRTFGVGAGVANTTGLAAISSSVSGLVGNGESVCLDCLMTVKLVSPESLRPSTGTP